MSSGTSAGEIVQQLRPPGQASTLACASVYVELTKPRVTLMVVLTAAAGFYLASSSSFDFALFLHAMLGTALVAGGTAGLNQCMERVADGKMRRTAGRPLPSGRLQPHEARLFSMLLVATGTFYLTFFTNLLTAFLGWLTLTIYLLLYTPLKKRTTLCTLVGAFPGAIPPLMGWAAFRGELNHQALALFLILFAWQFPHFLAISWIYREDYERGGFTMLPIVDPDGRKSGRQILGFSVGLLCFSLLPAFFGMTGWIYPAAAAILGTYFMKAGWQVSVSPSRPSARGLLKASIIYLPLLLGAMILDKI